MLSTDALAIDYATGLYAAYSITSALYLRERTGRGQRTTVSLLETQELVCGDAQEIRVVGSPVHLGLVEPVETTAPPALGADTAEIRARRGW